jgi:hypothetical protein
LTVKFISQQRLFEISDPGFEISNRKKFLMMSSIGLIVLLTPIARTGERISELAQLAVWSLFDFEISDLKSGISNQQVP